MTTEVACYVTYHQEIKNVAAHKSRVAETNIITSWFLNKKTIEANKFYKLGILSGSLRAT